MSAVYKEYRIGARMLPLGSPALIGKYVGRADPWLNRKYRFLR